MSAPAQATVHSLPVRPPQPPCFYYEDCERRAEVEKAGRAVCRWHAEQLPGQEFPLRPPERAPMYARGTELALELGMQEPGGLNSSESANPPMWRTATTERRANLRAACLARQGLSHVAAEADYTACPDCGKRFVPERSTRIYCSHTCRNRARRQRLKARSASGRLPG